MRAGPFGPAVRTQPRNAAPVPLTARYTGPFGVPLARSTDAQLATTGGHGLLWQIIDRLSSRTASVNWRLYRKATSGRTEDRTEVTRHAALDLLNTPNKFFLRSELLQTGTQHRDLIGEAILLVTRIAGPKSLPLELWPVRPDRMEPVPHPVDFIAHWWYHGPNGEKIYIDNADVLRIKLPNPLDLYRGLGPVQALMSDIDTARYGAEWNRNFFINGAEPGGIIEVQDQLSDEQFDTATARWAQQHRGVANAHRVAIIEGGAKWVDRKASMRDLQIAELRAIPDEQVRKAYGYPTSELGDKDVNRATAWAGKATFAEGMLVPRLDEWKLLFNYRLLPMYAGGAGLEFDYDNPVPPDAEAENAERQSKVDAAVKLIDAGFDAAAVLKQLGLPDLPTAAGDGSLGAEAIGNLIQSLYLGTPEKAAITWDEAREILRAAGVPLAEGVPAPVVASGPPVQARAERLPVVPAAQLETVMWIRAQAGDDLAAVQEQWEAALEQLLAEWGDITEAQRDALLDQIEDLIEDGAIGDLAELEVESEEGAELLALAMLNLGVRAAKQQADEASKQGVSVAPARVQLEDFEPGARAAAGLLASGLAAAAGREALRLATPGVSARQVTEDVRSFIDDLTDRTLRDQLGGQLTAAQNQARFATLDGAPPAEYYASEELDGNTCSPCREVDGRQFMTLDEARALYANGGYTRCQGRERCRGTVVAVWEET